MVIFLVFQVGSSTTHLKFMALAICGKEIY